MRNFHDVQSFYTSLKKDSKNDHIRISIFNDTSCIIHNNWGYKYSLSQFDGRIKVNKNDFVIENEVSFSKIDFQLEPFENRKDDDEFIRVFFANQKAPLVFDYLIPFETNLTDKADLYGEESGLKGHYIIHPDSIPKKINIYHKNTNRLLKTLTITDDSKHVFINISNVPKNYFTNWYNQIYPQKLTLKKLDPILKTYEIDSVYSLSSKSYIKDTVKISEYDSKYGIYMKPEFRKFIKKKNR